MLRHFDNVCSLRELLVPARILFIDTSFAGSAEAQLLCLWPNVWSTRKTPPPSGIRLDNIGSLLASFNRPTPRMICLHLKPSGARMAEASKSSILSVAFFPSL